MAASAFAGQGYFHISLVVLTAFLGNILGDIFGYWLARRYGKTVLYKIGFRKILESDTYDWIETEVDHYKALVVFFSRVNVVSTISVNIVAGLLPMSFKKFFAYAVLGELVQVLFYAIIGYTFGSNWQALYEVFGQFTLALFLVILVALTVISNSLQKRLVKRRNAHIASK
jgi:membrane-associated protein